jgi:hypothetical protein
LGSGRWSRENVEKQTEQNARAGALKYFH